MNKKMWIALGVCAAVVLLILLTVAGPKQTNADAPQANTSAASDKTTDAVANENTDNSAANPNGDTADATEAAPSETVEDINMEELIAENSQLGVEEDESAGESLEESSAATTPTQPATPSQPAQPGETVQPTEPDLSILGDDFNIRELTYEGYHALTGDQQRAVISIFGTPEDFMVWYSAVEEAYKSEHPDIEIGGDGVVDLG